MPHRWSGIRAPERLRELTERMPNSQVTEFGNVVVKARVDSRSTRSTFVVVEGAIEWVSDDDFGYEVASSLPGVDDIDILPAPRAL